MTEPNPQNNAIKVRLKRPSLRSSAPIVAVHNGADAMEQLLALIAPHCPACQGLQATGRSSGRQRAAGAPDYSGAGRGRGGLNRAAGRAVPLAPHCARHPEKRDGFTAALPAGGRRHPGVEPGVLGGAQWQFFAGWYGGCGISGLNWGKKAQFVKERTCEAKPQLNADEMSEFYREFLNANWQNHVKYNFEWYRRNFALLGLALRVSLEGRFRLKYI
ncbi:hypothetical protein YQE_08435, partial [Dendroctonus ponderosae]